MVGVTMTDFRSTSTGPSQARLARRVLVANIVSGTLWLVPLAFSSWPLSLIGAVYVAVASVFLAAVYARGALTRRKEAMAWAAPWLAAVLLWAWVGAGVDGGEPGSAWLPLLWFGPVIATRATWRGRSQPWLFGS
jgi:hypothetical protein